MDFPWQTIIVFDHWVSRDFAYLDYTNDTKQAYVDAGKTPAMKADSYSFNEDGTEHTYWRSWTDEQSALEWIEFIKTIPNSGLISARHEFKG